MKNGFRSSFQVISEREALAYPLDNQQAEHNAQDQKMIALQDMTCSITE
jgi:hypothetical protein